MAQGYKTGGRQKGTPNKPNPIKEQLRAASAAYFTPHPQTDPDGSPRKILIRDKDGLVIDQVTLADPDGSPLVISDFQADTILMEPRDRAAIHEKILRYHTAPLQAVAADLSLHGDLAQSIEQRLADLATTNDN